MPVYTSSVKSLINALVMLLQCSPPPPNRPVMIWRKSRITFLMWIEVIPSPPTISVLYNYYLQHIPHSVYFIQSLIYHYCYLPWYYWHYLSPQCLFLWLWPPLFFPMHCFYVLVTMHCAVFLWLVCGRTMIKRQATLSLLCRALGPGYILLISPNLQAITSTLD